MCNMVPPSQTTPPAGISSANSDELWVCHLGHVPYSDAVAVQETVRALRQAGELPDVLLLLEHPPVYTRGRRAGAEDLPFGEDFYRAKGIDVASTDRGGKLTYHGPGQLVGYPIMAIDDVARHLRTMEDAIVAALGEQGVGRALACERGRRLHRRVGRRPQDRLDRRARLARRHHARLRRQRRQRPRAVLVGGRLRPARRAHDLAARRARRRRARRRVLCKEMAYRFCEAHGRRQRLVSPARLGIDAARSIRAAPTGAEPIESKSLADQQAVPA